MTRIKKRILFLFNNQPALCLAIFCLLIYMLKNYSLIDLFIEIDKPSSSKFYIETAKYGDYPVIYHIENPGELERLIPSSIYKRIQSGDKVMIYDKGNISLSRISGKKSLALGIQIGINSASKDDLTALQGVGVKLAEGIVNYRESVGRFKSIDDLYGIKGMGKKKIEAIRPFINLD
ncbi:MAG: helix-hairpin-helix domain-containing protein [Candidatus Dadabacteria bacterium]|nr:helix-hairpin-helix domain-containing protein [Candidatus Dadabacteria bacterium]